MKLFYRPEQSAANASSFSPSAGKPALVVADWLRRGLVQPEDVLDFDPVSRADLYRAHDASYVDAVLDLREPNGFDNHDAGVAASLPFTCGSLLAACRHALATGSHVCSPTSGFHHAHHGHGQGFCTFNGLMVAALALKAEGRVKTLAILDLDMHYGNGTEQIRHRLGSDWIVHRTQGESFGLRSQVGDGAEHYFAWLEEAIEACRQADLVIYQAGADPHVHDPLGGLLTGQELAIRDHRVFKAFQGQPLVWNLAGGYQLDAQGRIEPVLKIHRGTLIACQVQAGERCS